MIAAFLLLVMLVDTCITAFLLARVKALSSDLAAQASLIKDISEDD